MHTGHMEPHEDVGPPADAVEASSPPSALHSAQRPPQPTSPQRPPPQLTAQEVIEVYKREGHFDRLRKQMVKDFLDSRASDEFYDRIDDIVQRHLDRVSRQAAASYPPRVPWTSSQLAYEDALREVQRHPLLERTLGDIERRQLPQYTEGIDRELMRIIDDKRTTMPPPVPVPRDTAEVPSEASPTLPGAVTQSTAQTAIPG